MCKSRVHELDVCRSLPEHFKNNGYNVAGSGKLFHPHVPANYDQPWSWTTPYIELGDNATNTCTETCCGITDNMNHYCAYDLKPGTYLADQRNTQAAIANLEKFNTDYKASGAHYTLHTRVPLQS